MENRVQLLLTNPREAMERSWFGEPAVFDAFLVRCKNIVNGHPKAGKEPTLFIMRHAPTNCHHSGSHSDLLEAEKYLKQARRLFIGVRKGSQERARLDWVTAQVRFHLRKEKPYRTMETMERSLADFLALGFTHEAVAVGADIMKMKTAQPWGRDSYRPVIRRTLKTLSGGLPMIPNDLREALERVDESARAHHLGSHQVLKDAIDSLREVCGPTIPCLVSW